MKNPFRVISPDGLPFPKRFSTREAAQAAVTDWCRRFERQGYYASVDGRISLTDLPGRCTITEEVVK